MARGFPELCSSVAWIDRDVFRNIKSIFESQNLFDDLIDGEDDFAAAVEAVSLGSARGPSPLVSRPFEYGSVISYSFDASNWQQTRFSDGKRYGVWYGSFDLETTIHETVHHWRKFLLDSYADLDREIVSERRVFCVTCQALLIDLRGREDRCPELVSRSEHGFCQALGAYLVEQGQNGLVVRSARCDGVNVAVFRPERLSNVRDHCFLVYSTKPTQDTVRVERRSSTSKTWLLSASSLA